MVEWRPFPPEPRYLVSDNGQIMSVRFGRPLIPSPDDRGYLQVSLTRACGRHWTVKVHRAVMLTFVGPRPDGLSIDHIDGNKTNNCLANLSYIPCSENSAQAGRQAKGRPMLDRVRASHRMRFRGEGQPQSKLTESSVLEIRRRVLAGERTALIAAAFGVTLSLIRKIHRRKLWSHVA